MLQLDFINVGYGDSILVQSFSQERTFRMLVDCGDGRPVVNLPGQRKISTLEFLQKRDIRELDLLILTHMHKDHIGGFAAVADTVAICEVWTGYLPEESLFRIYLSEAGKLPKENERILKPMYRVFQTLNQLREKGVPVRLMRGENRFSFSDLGFELIVTSAGETLFQTQNQAFEAISNGIGSDSLPFNIHSVMNDSSLRIRLCYGMQSVELPGDFCAAAWLESAIRPCTLLKLPHHGHADSMTEALFSQLSPAVTVISVSDDRVDDCPAKAVVDLIRRNGSELLFTGHAPEDFSETDGHESVRVMLNQDSIYWEV